jgi:acyl carrier protein
LVWFDPDGVRQQVEEIIMRNLGLRAGWLSETSSLMEEIGADSLDIVELILELEEKFEIGLPDEKVQGIKTVDDLIDFIVRQIGERRAED